MKTRMMVLAALVGLSGSSLLAATSISGKYVEARTAEVFTGGCIMSSEADTVGKQAVLAWKVDRGSFNGISLDGLSVVAALSGDVNLGIHEIGGQRATVKSAVVVDERANAAQRSDELARKERELAGRADAESEREVRLGVEAARLERLRDEHDYPGGETVVKEAVRAWRQSHQEVFLPLSHPPGEAQVDFGEATIWLAGQEIKVALFVMTLPYSGAIFMQAFPRECTETFLEGHRRAFEFLGGVPKRISYDNSAIAVIEVLKGRERKLTREFLRLQSHYLFQEHFCLVRRPTRKGMSSDCWDSRGATFWCLCRTSHLWKH